MRSILKTMEHIEFQLSFDEFETRQDTAVLNLIFDASHHDLKEYILLLFIS